MHRSNHCIFKAVQSRINCSKTIVCFLDQTAPLKCAFIVQFRQQLQVNMHEIQVIFRWSRGKNRSKVIVCFMDPTAPLKCAFTVIVSVPLTTASVSIQNSGYISAKLQGKCLFFRSHCLPHLNVHSHNQNSAVLQNGPALKD